MELNNRIKNKLFKSYLKNSIEYHAGGFFVRKTAAYFFFDELAAFYCEKEEGLHPSDNDYLSIVKKIKNEKEKQIFNLLKVNDNVLIFKNEIQIIKIVPSIFIENVVNENLNEILVDWGGDITQIYSLVSSNILD